MAHSSILNTGLYFAYKKISYMWDKDLVQDCLSLIVRIKIERLLHCALFIDLLEELILSEAIKYLQI